MTRDLHTGGRSIWRACFLVFGVALAVRLFFLLKIPGDYILPNAEWEIDSIAFVLVENG